jgi:hypothetical protein
MRIHQVMMMAAVTIATAAQAEEPFIYRCKGTSRILPSGLALGKVEWMYEIQPDKKLAVFPDGGTAPMEIDQYRISFPLKGKVWISITRVNGHFYVVDPIDDSERKMQEYRLFEGECKRGA